ncbi:MAG: protein translocase subunit SecD [Clostridia bacterium]
MRTKKPVFFIIVVVCAIVACIAAFGVDTYVGTANIAVKGAPQMRFGIDIKGGIEAYFKASDEYKPTPEDLAAAKIVFEKRLDGKGVLDRDVIVDSNNGTLLVRFPFKSNEDASNADATIVDLGKTAKLEFKDPDGKVILTGKNVKESKAQFTNQSKWVIGLKFDAEGTKLFDEATGRLLKRNIGIYIDDQEISSPTVNAHIVDGQAVIEGSYTQTTATDMANQIQSGALPFNMETSSYNIISPSLGSGALKVMVNAGALALIIILLFMLLYYRLPGLSACIALIMQISLQILAVSIPQFSLTLPGIAGIILSMGMGVDANIIISERIKEELRSGKTLTDSINTGFKRALSSVIDSNMTGIIVAVILMVLGSGSMWSFGYTLLTGTAINLITGVVGARLMTRSLSSFQVLRNPRFYGMRKENKNEKV